jgi:hypothetical protein
MISERKNLKFIKRAAELRNMSEKDLIDRSRRHIKAYVDYFKEPYRSILDYAFIPVLIKEHHYEEDLYNLSCSINLVSRDIRDSISSRRRRGKGLYSKGIRMDGGHQYDENSYEGFGKYCEYLVEDCNEKWKDRDNSEKVALFEFERFSRNKIATVKKIYKSISKCLISRSPNPEFVFESLEENYEYKIEKVLENIETKNIKSENYGTFFTKDKITNDGKIGGYGDMITSKEEDYIVKTYPSYIFSGDA